MNDLSCKPNFNLLLSRDVNSPRLCYVNKRWWRVNALPVNLTLTSYYFELLLLSRDVNSPRLCYVDKDGEGVNDLPYKPNSDLLLSRGVNSKRPCYVNNEVDRVTLCKPNFNLSLS